MGYIYLYTGEGGGKTTNALGLALRTLGHGQKVVIIQFLKWWKETGEYKFKHPNYTILQYGREGWHGFDNLTEEDKELAFHGLSRASAEIYRYTRAFLSDETINNRVPDLLILDEINLTVHLGLLSEKDVIDFLDSIPEKTTIVMTGRYATQALIDRADFVNTIEVVKMPKEVVTTKGIQY